MKPNPDSLKDFKLLTQVKPGSSSPFPILSEPSAPCCGGCCGGPTCAPTNWPKPSAELPFVEDEIDTKVGKPPRVSHRRTFADHWGAFSARWGINRMSYAVSPGLYALGEPDERSEVLVSANYKLSFDKLRSALAGVSAWILVLDTAGINVWCAAGKGTFGTAELTSRIETCRIAELVSHRRVIVPQLGAPGVAAHLVKSNTGFKVVYGPILAEDIPDFLAAGRKATPEMRRKRFPLKERAELIPVELVDVFKVAALLSVAFFFLGGLGGPGDYWTNAFSSGLLSVYALAAAAISGAILVPLLLPWLPGRAFSIKGLSVGLAMAAIVVYWLGGDLNSWLGRLEAGAWLLIVPALAAFIAMNFTGASTYTSLSGVQKEMRRAVPAQIAAGALGLILWIGARFAG